ncbi:amino acid adenylation domain-containing protein, partial [Lysinibacillus sphaericus]
SGRTHADVKDIMGMFVNTVAIRTYPRGEKTFLQLVEEVKRDTLEALENQDYPYDVLVEKLELKRDLSRNPLFDTMFDLQHVESIVPFELGDTHVSPYELTNTTSKFDLTFTIEEKDSQLTLNIEYATSLFDIEIIESLKNHFIQILYNVTQNSSNKISQINIIENIEEEGEDCINKDFLSSFTEKVFHEIFEQQVSKTPNKIAVVCGEETLTYDELNKKSNQLARKLVSLDVNSDTIVGIIADKSLGMIVGILGVLKAGGAYVPIDPTTPLERITSIIDDCGAEIILTNKNYYHLINNQQKIDLDEESLFKGNSCNLNISVNKDDLVYVIYTSGSTGKPKGVMISHKNYLSIAYSWNNIYKLQEFDVKLLQLASFSFDVFAGDLARTLLFGGQLILCSTDTILDFKLLSQLIVNNKINILESTPKLLIPLLQYIYENKVDVSFMKIIIFGSDVCPMPDFKIIIQRFGGNIRIFNTYGTTETTIDSLFYEGNSIANKECNYVPIGKAFPNTKTYVLNRYLQKQPVGVIGELYIEGEGIARGYLNNINLTEEKFIPNPFNKHSRLYKTGDLVRKLKDGNIEFIGRKDNQVKISGYRIELGEIETFILGYDGIDNVVVNIGSNETGDEFFCAYIESKYEIDIKQLKNYLYLHLPKYMIPDSFVLLKSLPLSKNGKIEKKSLPIPNKKFENKKYIPPNNDIEIMITNIWSEILNVENIGRNDNFFDLGGNSLKIVTFVNWLRKEFKFDIPVQLIFNNPNVQMIAKIIAEKSNKVTKSSLVELTRLNNPKKKNIICFPPIIGLGMIYSKMAELLNNKFSLYALDIPEENINIMDIIEKLKKIQDKSPFIFLSYSAGGNLAFEVAKVMENKGISVSCIVMLDSLPLNNIVKASTEAIEFEIENAMTDYVENSGKFLGSALIKEQLKDEDFYIRKKMRSFIKFLNNTINKPYINADIHLINANNNYDIDKKLIKWEGYTKKFTEHKGYGEHKEMFNSYNIIKNTEVIQKILGKY